MSLIIAGERSGVGKTTVTLAILAYLAQTNKAVQAFKVGPDYIDPMFHRAVTKRASRNLDPVLTSVGYVERCFALHSSQTDYALVEGVMGLFDGITIDKETDYASTAHIARILKLPVLLVLDCSSLSGSIAAIAHGFKTFDPQVKIAGVVLNRIKSDRHLELITVALNQINLPIFGVLRYSQHIDIPDRHLGLIPVEELSQSKGLFEELASIAREAFDWKQLLPLLQTKQEQPATDGQTIINHYPPKDSAYAIAKRYPLGQQKVKIAIARDRAFNFYYQDNLDILEELGAELCFWSPLEDSNIPSKVAGFYFGGGFPEMFAQELSQNQQVISDLRQLIAFGTPVYAECGGLMYLCDRLIDFQGKSWQMVGAIPATAKMTSRLSLGYRQAVAANNSSLVNVGRSVLGHEFHRSAIDYSDERSLWELKSFSYKSTESLEGWQNKEVHASYLHLHFGEYRDLLQKWLKRCLNQKYPLL